MRVQIDIDLSLFHAFPFFFYVDLPSQSRGKWAKTLSGDSFLLRADGIGDKMLVFGMLENLSKLADLDTIYVDGTFATCLSLYCQLFTINGIINSQQFPLVYSFLPTKSRADYNRFFTIVKEEMQNQGLTFQATQLRVILSLLYCNLWNCNSPTLKH